MLLLAGLLFALSFPGDILGSTSLQHGLPPLVFLFALPLLQVLRQLRSLREALFYGAFYGFSSYLMLSLWLLDYDWIAFILIPGIYLYYFSIFFAAYYLLVKVLRKYGLPPFLCYIVFVLFWMVLEYTKSTGWVAYTYGSLLYSHYLFPAVMHFSRNFLLQNLSYVLILAPAICLHILLCPAPVAWRRAVTRLETKRLSVGLRQICRDNNGWLWLVIAGTAVGVLHLSFALGHSAETGARPEIRADVLSDVESELSANNRSETLTALAALPVSPDKLNVALLQHDINSWQTEENTNRQALERLLYLSRRAEERNAELIVWSETAFVPNYRLNRDSDTGPALENIRELEAELTEVESQEERSVVADNLRYFRNVYEEILQAKELQQYLLQAKATYLIGTNDYGRPQEFPGEKRWGLYNSLLLIRNGVILGTYHKQRLVPFTEEGKWEDILPRLNVLLRKNGFAQYSAGTGSPILRLPLQGKIRPTLKIYAMICYEDSVPLYRPHRLPASGEPHPTLAERDFDVLLSVSNDSWSPSPIGGLQHLSSAVSRAWEVNRYFLRGSTSGQTAVIGPKEGLLGRLPPNIPGILYFRLPLAEAR
ncbi:apolipoprotein N-acyltransferase [Candidatus Haliotispira prima]|uniref:Apolipoprotein N-acyltransferase n=1 Tax=Candidatus Haliotispira prima TaxID=3034016 RepID=A0ABY8MJQ2_9SPIO|nr:apolipoprotein N-acyltransferase [Candidatus Haliotispira prima]